MYAKVLASIPIEPRAVHELTPRLWWQYFSLGMVTVAVLDYFLTLDDEVCGLRVSALNEANLLAADQPYMEQTEVMDVLRILPGQNSSMNQDDKSRSTLLKRHRTGIPSRYSSYGNKSVSAPFPNTN